MFTSNLTKQQGKAGAIKPYCCSLHPSFITPIIGAVPPLKLVTMQSHPRTLEIPDSCLLIEMFMEFRKLGFFSICFTSTIFTCLFNLICFV
jgi:hypothetical protein